MIDQILTKMFGKASYHPFVMGSCGCHRFNDKGERLPYCDECQMIASTREAIFSALQSEFLSIYKCYTLADLEAECVAPDEECLYSRVGPCGHCQTLNNLWDEFMRSKGGE